MGRLELQLKFEEDEVVEKQIAAILVVENRLPESYLVTDNQIAGL